MPFFDICFEIHISLSEMTKSDNEKYMDMFQNSLPLCLSWGFQKYLIEYRPKVWKSVLYFRVSFVKLSLISVVCPIVFFNTMEGNSFSSVPSLPHHKTKQPRDHKYESQFDHLIYSVTIDHYLIWASVLSFETSFSVTRNKIDKCNL